VCYEIFGDLMGGKYDTGGFGFPSVELDLSCCVLKWGRDVVKKKILFYCVVYWSWLQYCLVLLTSINVFCNTFCLHI
jgi:hypothetical protein